MSPKFVILLAVAVSGTWQAIATTTLFDRCYGLLEVFYV
jgi:hypothetical protein